MRDHILELIKAQDYIRRAWAEFSGTILEKPLREVDREVTKLIVQIDTMYPKKKEETL